MKTKLVLVAALVATLMLALFLVGCGGTVQTHPRTVKDVDLTKYADLEVGNLVVILPDGTEKKYDVAADFWAEQAEDSVWFYDEYKYALVIEKGIITGIAPYNGGAYQKYDHAIALDFTRDEEGGVASYKGFRVAVDKDTSLACKPDDTVVVCGNIDDGSYYTPLLNRNTQVVVV